MRIFRALRKIIQTRKIRSSWHFEKMQFYQVNRFMTGWGLKEEKMENMTREEITRWWKHRQDMFEASFLKRMTYFNSEVGQSFLPLLSPQMEVRRTVDVQLKKLDAD